MSDVVTFERKGHVALITLNRPEARNAISPEMLVQLAGTWTAVRDDPIRRFCHPGSRLAAHSRVLASCAQVDRRGGGRWKTKSCWASGRGAARSGSLSRRSR